MISCGTRVVVAKTGCVGWTAVHVTGALKQCQWRRNKKAVRTDGR